MEICLLIWKDINKSKKNISKVIYWIGVVVEGVTQFAELNMTDYAEICSIE